MYIEELQEALADDRARAIEHGFATLVAWPTYDNLIGSTADVRQVALVAVCEALVDNLRPLPREIVERMEAISGISNARTFYAGACLVLATWPAFAQVVDK